jgi:hypothetical protein
MRLNGGINRPPLEAGARVRQAAQLALENPKASVFRRAHPGDFWIRGSLDGAELHEQLGQELFETWSARLGKDFPE